MIKWILILVLAANWVNGQNVTLNSNNSIKLSLDFSLFVPQNEHQYIATQWAKGKFFYANGTSKPYDSINFDRYENVIEVVVNNKALSIMPMGLSGALIYNSSNSGTILIVGEIDERSRFLMLQSEGQYILVSYMTTNEMQEETNYKTDEIRFVPKSDAKLVLEENYFILSNGAWREFKISRSSISKLFKVEKKELQSIASENGIITGSKSGLIELFQLLNDH
jgi:hypothetical protein